VNGELVFSKLKTGRFPDSNDLNGAVYPAIDKEL
jgi:hypothetical protein